MSDFRTKQNRMPYQILSLEMILNILWYPGEND